MMDAKQVKNIVEACLLVAGKAMSLRQLDDLFEGDENRPDKESIKTCVEELQTEYEGRGIELVQVASGYRLQSRAEVSDWVARLFPEKPPRYSRALLETLVLVAYRQPITRGEIEEIRGVAVSSNIVKTLQERQWVKEVGFKDVPGKPALLGTTKSFLDYFNLKRLDDLPPLSEIKNLDEMDTALMEAAGIAPAAGPEAANESAGKDTNDGTGEGVSENENVGDQDEQATHSANEAEDPSEKTVYAAGEAGNTATNSDETDGELVAVSDDLDHEESGAVLEVGNSNDQSIGEDAPVTFAGLLSRLPARPDSDSKNNAEVDASGGESDEISQPSEPEVHDAETTVEQPDAEEKLRAAVSEFANEHQREIEARDELESQLETRDTESANEKDDKPSESEPDVAMATKDAEPVVAEAVELTEEASDALGDAIDASATSPEALSDTFAGDSPGAGETLH